MIIYYFYRHNVYLILLFYLPTAQVTYADQIPNS